MVMRIIAPLDEEDWIKLVTDLEKGQTKEQAIFFQEALKHAKSLKVAEY